MMDNQDFQQVVQDRVKEVAQVPHINHCAYISGRQRGQDVVAVAVNGDMGSQMAASLIMVAEITSDNKGYNSIV